MFPESSENSKKKSGLALMILSNGKSMTKDGPPDGDGMDSESDPIDSGDDKIGQRHAMAAFILALQEKDSNSACQAFETLMELYR